MVFLKCLNWVLTAVGFLLVYRVGWAWWPSLFAYVGVWFGVDFFVLALAAVFKDGGC